jgi:integrase
MATRVEQDRHFQCEPGLCKAPAPRKLAVGRNQGRCIPRRTWWLRTVNSAGKRVSIGFKSEQEARTAAQKVEAARILGQDYTQRAAAAVPTFATVADEATKLYAQTRKLQPSTKAGHAWFLKHHLLPRLGTTRVTPENFSRLSIRRLIAELRGDLADSTLSTALAELRIVLDHAVDMGLLPSNPMRGAAALWVAEAKPEVDPFSAAEIRAIVRAAASFNPEFALMVELEARTGVRPGELMALRRGDVDARTGTVEIHGSWHHGRRGPTKTRHSERRVSFLHPVLEDVAAWRPGAAGGDLTISDRLAVLVAVAPDVDSPLFPSATQPLQPMGDTRRQAAWEKAVKLAGVRYRKMDALRHSFASILLSRGAPLLYVQRQGGWKGANVLLGTYAKWMPEGDLASTGTSSELTTRNVEACDLDAGVLELVAAIDGGEQRGDALDGPRIAERAHVDRAQPHRFPEIGDELLAVGVGAAEEQVALDGVVTRGQLVRGDVVERGHHACLGAEDLLCLLGGGARGRRGEQTRTPERERDHGAHHDLAAAGLPQLGQGGPEPGGRHREHHDFGGGGRVAVRHALDPPAGRRRGQLGRLGAGALGIARSDDHVVPGLRPPEAQSQALLAGSTHDADPHGVSSLEVIETGRGPGRA